MSTIRVDRSRRGARRAGRRRRRRNRRFCRTVRVAVERELLRHVAEPLRACGARRAQDRTRRRAPSPAVGRSRPHSILKVVDLPAPLGPSRPKISPRGTAKRDPVGGGEVAEALGQLARPR